MSEDPFDNLGAGLIGRVRQALAGHRPRRIEDRSLAPAAVLILLYRTDSQLCLLLTERSQEVELHKGQMAFPGGACDERDGDLLATALRETFEEIGVRPEDVEVIGQLDDVPTISDYLVTPFVGVIRSGASRSGYPFVIEQREVAALVEVPLPHLLDERNKELEVRQWKGKPVLVPAYTHGRRRIFGATAIIIDRFLGLLS
ncbi:MAG: NUDIX hydrolase [Dehalococcoidia bacterium]